MELCVTVRDVVFRVIEDVWVVPGPEGEVVDSVFLLGIELGKFGLLTRFLFGLPF